MESRSSSSSRHEDENENENKNGPECQFSTAKKGKNMRGRGRGRSSCITTTAMAMSISMSMSMVIMLTTTLNATPTFGAITISDSEHQLPSRAAAFGMEFEYGLQYVAKLQVVEGDLHLCHGIKDTEKDMTGGMRGFDGFGGFGKDGDYFDEGDDTVITADSNLPLSYNRNHPHYYGYYHERRSTSESSSSSASRLRIIDFQHFKKWFEDYILRRPTSTGAGTGGRIVNVIQDDHDRVGEGDYSNFELMGERVEDVEEDGKSAHDGEIISSLGGTLNKKINRRRTQGHTEDNSDGGDKDPIQVVPTHGVPVAILAKRGQCTYETKARVASQMTSPHGLVRFVIVYDNNMENGNHLITMMPMDHTTTNNDNDNDNDPNFGKKGHQLYNDIGLTFISYESGIDLHDLLNMQSPYSRQDGGPRILIDGTERWFPSYTEPAAGLALLLILFGCVCSLSLFLGSTAFGVGGRDNDSIVNEHHLYLLGPDGQVLSEEERQRRANERRNRRSNNGRRRGNGLRLLTMEEVETLPTREYVSPGSSGSASPTSSSLELRDKSEMPYLADDDDDDDEGGNGQGGATDVDADGEVDGASRNCGSGGGGLCQHLMEKFHHHNTCSICLDEYEIGEQIRVLPCEHTFHSQCIFPWLTERSPTCPLCKAMFEAVRYEEDEEDEEGNNVEDNANAEEGRHGQPENEEPAEAADEAPNERRRSRHRGNRSPRRSQRSSDNENHDIENANANTATSASADDEGGTAATATINTSADADEMLGANNSRQPWWNTRSERFLSFFGRNTTAGPDAPLEEPLLSSGNDQGQMV